MPGHKSRVRAGAALAGLVGVLLLGACSSSPASSSPAAGSPSSTAMPSMTSGSAAPAVSSAANTVVITNFMFQPMSLTVAPGTVVTVRNEDSTTHTLTAASGSTMFSAGDIAAGKSATFKAPAKAGSYGFICMIHQYMTGTIVVR
jgi:plastocyanin